MITRPQPVVAEISTLGDAYGTGTLYCTPSPSATPTTTPWSTPIAPPKMNFASRKGSCPSFSKCQENSDSDSQDCSPFTPFLLPAALPVVSCAIAPVTAKVSRLGQMHHSDYRLNHSTDDYFSGDFVRRSTVSDIPSLVSHREYPIKFASEVDLNSLSKSDPDVSDHPRSRSSLILIGDRQARERVVPLSLDITSPKFASISSNDTFLTANTSTPQENSKYSFHSVLDSSLDSYLTLTLSSPNPSPPTFLESALSQTESPPLSSTFSDSHAPKSILKKEAYSLPEYASHYPSDSLRECRPNSLNYQPRGKVLGFQSLTSVGSEATNDPLHSVKIDPCDRDRLEHIKKMISEKIVESLSNYPNGYKNKYLSQPSENGAISNALNSDYYNILETHL